MPFIRYRTGDLATFSSNTCQCGRNYTLFDDIEGRNYEYVFTKDGRKISLTGLIFGQHFNAFRKIDKMQLLQPEQNLVEDFQN